MCPLTAHLPPASSLPQPIYAHPVAHPPRLQLLNPPVRAHPSRTRKKKLSIVYPHPVRSRSPGDPPVHLPPSPFAPTRPLTARLSPSHFTPPGRLYHVAHPIAPTHLALEKTIKYCLPPPSSFALTHPPVRLPPDPFALRLREKK